MSAEVPAIVREQLEQARLRPDLTREEAERDFPEMLNWIRDQVPLVDLLRDSGVELRPLSPDAPGVFVGECPFCSSGPLLVRST